MTSSRVAVAGTMIGLKGAREMAKVSESTVKDAEKGLARNGVIPSDVGPITWNPYRPEPFMAPEDSQEYERNLAGVNEVTMEGAVAEGATPLDFSDSSDEGTPASSRRAKAK